ncbi:MAG: TMEM164 family acyltransferase [Candidatus Xenobia bacterium]
MLLQPPFHFGSLDHIGGLLAIAACALLAARLSRTRHEALLRHVLAGTLLAFLVITYANIRHGPWQWQWDLPLGLCDVVMFVSCAALIILA